MKDKLVDKKIVVLFLIMIFMVIFMIIFLSRQNKNLQEELNMETGDIISTINKKQKEISDFLNNDNGLFSEGLLEIFRKLDLVSYIDLPLEVNSKSNNYPFGSGEDLE
jgi:cell division protein FtsL